jgi:hypothetical protein
MNLCVNNLVLSVGQDLKSRLLLNTPCMSSLFFFFYNK